MNAERHSVEFTPSGECFDVEAGETVLDAALRQGIQIRYGCRSGKCSTCKFQVEDGEVDHGDVSVYSLPDAQRDEGWVLLCRAQPLTDLLIRDNRLPDTRALPALRPRLLEAQVVEAKRLTPELWELRLGLTEPLEFYAGQFAELGLAVAGRSIWRSYSMASAPSQDRELCFVIKEIAQGAFSGQLSRLQPGLRLQLRGPFGASYLRSGERPVLLCAIGSGIAPILAMLRTAAKAGDARVFHFFYGARRPDYLPYLEELRALFAGPLAAGSLFVPTLDGLVAEDSWSGSSGNVTQALQRELASAHPYDAYLCGAPPMCDTVARLLSAKGLAEDRLFMDRFFVTAKEEEAASAD